MTRISRLVRQNLLRAQGVSLAGQELEVNSDLFQEFESLMDKIADKVNSQSRSRAQAPNFEREELTATPDFKEIAAPKTNHIDELRVVSAAPKSTKNEAETTPAAKHETDEKTVDQDEREVQCQESANENLEQDQEHTTDKVEAAKKGEEVEVIVCDVPRTGKAIANEQTEPSPEIDEVIEAPEKIAAENVGDLEKQFGQESTAQTEVLVEEQGAGEFEAIEIDSAGVEALKESDPGEPVTTPITEAETTVTPNVEVSDGEVVAPLPVKGEYADASATQAGMEAATGVDSESPLHQDAKEQALNTSEAGAEFSYRALGAKEQEHAAIMSKAAAVVNKAASVAQVDPTVVTPNAIDTRTLLRQVAALVSSKLNEGVGAVQQNSSAAFGDSSFASKSVNTSRREESRPRALTRIAAIATMEKVEAALKEVVKSKDGKTISVRLDPPTLGSVKVDVSLRDGNLHARVSAESSQVQNLLKERAHEMHAILRKLGLPVDSVTVSVRDDELTDQSLPGFTQQNDTGEHKQQDSEWSSFDGFERGEPPVTKNDTAPQVLDHWVA